MVERELVKRFGADRGLVRKGLRRSACNGARGREDMRASRNRVQTMVDLSFVGKLEPERFDNALFGNIA